MTDDPITTTVALLLLGYFAGPLLWPVFDWIADGIYRMHCWEMDRLRRARRRP